MNLDPGNPVVKLCVAGVACENDHRFDDALTFYMQAWGQATDDFELCIAAHYVARHQKSVADALHWNLEALNRANTVRDNRAREFYPSLYLNVAKSYEEAGDQENAVQFFGLAADKVSDLPVGPYRDMLADGIQRGLLRVNENICRPST